MKHLYKKIVILGLAVIMLSVPFMAQSYAADYETVKDIQYIDTPTIPLEYRQLDLYFNKYADKPQKLMVFIHGGSWTGGDKNQAYSAQWLVPWFIERGYAVAVPNFRLASEPGTKLEVSYRNQVQDIAWALAALKKNAANFNTNANDVLLVGFESGAHLAALLCTDYQYLDTAGLHPSMISAAILMDSYVYDMPYAVDEINGTYVHEQREKLQYLFTKTEDGQKLASPKHYLDSATMPPTLLITASSSLKTKTYGYISKVANVRFQQALVVAGTDARTAHFDDEEYLTLIMDFGRRGDKPTETVERFLNLLGD